MKWVIKMNEALSNAKSFYESLSKEELIELLEKSGFEVEAGNGKVIYTDLLETSFSFTITSSLTTNIKATEIVKEENRIIIDNNKIDNPYDLEGLPRFFSKLESDYNVKTNIFKPSQPVGVAYIELKIA